MKINIGVIFGGASVEHEISIISANQVIHALDKEKYNVYPIYITKNQDLYYSTVYYEVGTFKDLKKAESEGTQIILKKQQNKIEMHMYNTKLFTKSLLHEIDIFFPVLHGTNGEDGTVQGMLEVLGATFVGCETKAAVNGQDKVFMKSILRDNKINVVDNIWFYRSDYFEDEDIIIKKIEDELSYPVIVKPASLGSSIGIKIARSSSEIKEAVEFALKYDVKILVEKVIDNLCEVNCAVLGDYSEQRTSAIEEVFQSDEILSYEDKYQSNDSKLNEHKGMAATQRIIPANIDPEIYNKVEEMAVSGFKALNLAGNTRIDFLINKASGEVYLNEVNTIPGSLAFYLWEAVNLPFNELCDEMIKLAIKTKREQMQQITTFETNVLENFNGSKGKLNN